MEMLAMNFLNQVTLLIFALVWGFSTPQASAVIVAGTSGTGNNNSTQAGLDAYLSSSTYAQFPYWNNLVRVADASGVYLGYNATTMRGWVLSANHVTTPTTIAVAGNLYAVTGTGTKIGSSDLKLYEIGGGGSDPALPSLPTVHMPEIAATPGNFLLMTGRGFTNSTTSPYAWGTPGTNDAYGMRWGTNTVEGTALVNIGSVPAPNIQPYVVVDFDATGNPGATAFDGQASLGDSGGGIFIYRAGEWQLSGIAHFVDDGPNFLEAIATGDNIVNPSQPGDFTAYSDVFSHAAAINGVTGTLIPEPSVISLLGLASLALCRHRRH
jgi:hypothetical protein